MAKPSSQDPGDTRSGNPRDLGDNLYGYLLEVDAALKDAGSLGFYFYILLFVVSCFVLWTERYRSIAALRNEELNHVFVYVLVFIILFIAFCFHIEIVKKLRYGRIRPELCVRIRESGKSRHQILATIEGNKALSAVAELLKRDRMEDEFG